MEKVIYLGEKKASNKVVPSSPVFLGKSAEGTYRDYTCVAGTLLRQHPPWELEEMRLPPVANVDASTILAGWGWWWGGGEG